MANEGFNPHSFLSWAKRRGLLDAEHGRITKKKLIGNLHPRCVCIKQDPNFVGEDVNILD
jgi:hypothetical protein